jgi:hypothetical protein
VIPSTAPEKQQTPLFIVSRHYFSFVIKPGIDATWFNVSWFSIASK